LAVRPRVDRDRPQRVDDDKSRVRPVRGTPARDRRGERQCRRLHAKRILERRDSVRLDRNDPGRPRSFEVPRHVARAEPVAGFGASVSARVR